MVVHVILAVLLDLFVSEVEATTCYTYSYYYNSVRYKYCSWSCCGSYGSHTCCRSTDDDYGWIAGVVVGVLVLIGILVAVIICVCIKKANARRLAVQPNRGQTIVMVSGQTQVIHPTTTVGYVPPPQGQYQNPAFGQPVQAPPPPNGGFSYGNTEAVYPPPPPAYAPPPTKY